MSGSLFDKLSSMSQDEGLGGAIMRWFNTIYELGEDHRFPAASGKRDTQPSMPLPEI